MKRMLTLLFLLVFFYQSKAQFSLTPEYSAVSAVLDEETVVHGTIQNLTTSTKQYRWERVIECTAEGWEHVVCDNKYCYGSDVYESPAPFTLTPFQSGNMDVHVKPHLYPGGASIKIKVYEVANPEIEKFMYVTFNTCIILGQDDINVAALKLFPNPANTQFQLSSVEGVRNIDVYNILGSRLKTFTPDEGKQYVIDDLNPGIYMVRLIGNNEKVLKTIRLSVR